MSRTMRWDCRARGHCWVERFLPDLTLYDQCFPGRIGMTDADGVVEVNARFLMVEWKTGRAIPRGQELMFERLTGKGDDWKVVVVDGNPATGETRGWCVFHNGQAAGWQDGDLDGLRTLFRQWADWAQSDRGMM